MKPIVLWHLFFILQWSKSFDIISLIKKEFYNHILQKKETLKQELKRCSKTKTYSHRVSDPKCFTSPFGNHGHALSKAREGSLGG
jgi:hypothetical protein